jgi:TolB-like protein/predicted Ser/Thr protein kinase
MLLGPYEILAPIGAGGMGEVWKARDTRLGRLVAIKQVKGQHTARFEQEARAIAALNHPNICTLHDVGPDYLVMEYVQGQPLTGPMTIEQALPLALQIASALEAAHKRGILHRDLKPANVIVTESGAKLLDFGLAKLTSESEAPPSATEATRTIEGTVAGTAAYMSPEQAQGQALDARSDIFSFGTLLYELLSGKRAFTGGSMLDTLNAVVASQPAPLDSPVSGVVNRCMAKRPSERFQSALELKEALKAALAEGPAKPASRPPSIAVLPFANMSGDKEQEYFSDGLAEEIINSLARIPGLKVIARTSAFAFKGQNTDIRRIGETLGVAHILEGSVRRSGNRIRVTTQLITAADGTHLWSERFDREMAGVFEVQDEIAGAIAGALKVTLTGTTAPRKHEPNLPAYEAFLKGRHHYYRFSPEAFAQAEESFQRAAGLDPAWADPYSALADLYFAIEFYGWRPADDMISQARAAARKALERLPSDPMAHAVLGIISALHDYDWKEAEEQFRFVRACEYLAPNGRLLFACFYLLALGRFDEAAREMAKAIVEDPLNSFWRSRLAWILMCAERYEEAIAEARKGLEFDQTNYQTHMILALALGFHGRVVEAREQEEEAFRLGPFDSFGRGFLAGLLANAGEKERSDQLIATMTGAVSIGMTIYNLVCGEIDAALDWYQKDIELRRPNAAMIAFAGYLRPLRSSPRWPKLARMMNLPE